MYLKGDISRKRFDNFQNEIILFEKIKSHDKQLKEMKKKSTCL